MPETWKEVSDRSRARKLGAKMLPQVRGRWYIPADVDLLVHLITADQWDYADNPLEELLKSHGKTITIRAMGDRKVLTKEPRHIKQILVGNFDNYVKGDELFGEATRAILGVGVFNSDAGPRICLGQQLAYNEASFFIIRLLQTFETITLRPDAQPQGTLPNSSGKWDLSAGRNGIEKVWPRTCMILFVEGGMWGVMGLGNDGSV